MAFFFFAHPHSYVVLQLATLKGMSPDKLASCLPLQLLEVFEDSEQYMLVMELCSGGELFDQIIAKVRCPF